MLNKNDNMELIILLLIEVYIPVFGQNNCKEDYTKLYVWIVVVQMGWDYLYRYNDRCVFVWSNLMQLGGFSFENAHINYNITFITLGYNSVYVSSVPAFKDIIRNAWSNKRMVITVKDFTDQPIGEPQISKSQSPRNLLVTIIYDKLKLSINLKRNVIIVSFSFIGLPALLPDGHLSIGSYWLGISTVYFATSIYYIDEIPECMQVFKGEELPEKYLNQTLKSLYSNETNSLSTATYKPYENMMIDKRLVLYPNYFITAITKCEIVINSPNWNPLTIDVCYTAIEEENLGDEDFTDLLVLGFSSSNKIDYMVKPNIIDKKDMYLNIDKEYAGFFEYLY